MRDIQRRDVHQDITTKIITAIEANPGSPEMPWHRPNAPLVLPVNIKSGNAYNGINIVSLWASSDAASYQVPVWGTYKQWQEADCQVRKGEKSTLVVFYKDYDVVPKARDASEPDPQTEGDDGKRRVARASWVFNAAQVDGYAPTPTAVPSNPIDRIANVDAFTSATRAEIRHGGARAYYRPSVDVIQMPDEHLFTGTSTSSRTENYYAVLLHELTHWCGAEKRLNRTMGKRFGDDAYAMEELVAELGAAFLCAELGITLEPRPDHAQYIANWVTVLKKDNRAIFAAAAKASEAVGFLKKLASGEGAAHG